MSSKIYDAAIIGAGAAGLMTAITAKRAGVPNVLLLDSKEKIGAKILMSGGTRCNLTNENVTEKDFNTEQKNILKSVLQFFPSSKAINFFQELGIQVVKEDGGKFFPDTHSGRTVLDALQKEVERLGIDLESPRKVTKLEWNEDLFKISGEGFEFKSKNVVLTTGGLSYPTSGSDGSGYAFASSFGHTLIETIPALTPLLSQDRDLQELSGLTLDAHLILWVQNKKAEEYTGSFLFTHSGYSGPVVLNISRHWIRAKKEPGTRITASFIPQIKEEVFQPRLMDQIQRKPNRPVKGFLTEFIAGRLAETLMKKAGIPDDTLFNELKRENRERLLTLLFRCDLGVTGAAGYQKAEVTAGGVPLSEVQRRTLESKLRPGLFFAGEILDVDGRIGGFNFQWAWSSGMVAGTGIAEKFK